MSRTHEIESQLAWTAHRSTSGSVWIAECDALGLVLEATTLDELHSLIPEALRELLTDLITDGDLDEFLLSKGWSAVDIPPLRDFVRGGDAPLPWNMTTRDELNDLHEHAA